MSHEEFKMKMNGFKRSQLSLNKSRKPRSIKYDDEQKEPIKSETVSEGLNVNVNVNVRIRPRAAVANNGTINTVKVPATVFMAAQRASKKKPEKKPGTERPTTKATVRGKKTTTKRTTTRRTTTTTTTRKPTTTTFKSTTTAKPPISSTDSLDWRDRGAVSPVKDQGVCGSCYTFSTTGALESCNIIKNNKTTLLSEQHLVDCSKNDYGCGGGLMENSFRYIIANKGINSESSYPYKGTDTDGCKYNHKDVAANVVSFKILPEGDEAALEVALQDGPVTIAVDASQSSFQNYKIGIYDDKNCKPENIDHAVLLVGYGVEKETGRKFWTIKNSWGKMIP
jgi:C1A family cysteine protease